MQSFEQSAQLYDALYAAKGKPYSQEASTIHDLLTLHGLTHGATLLDVACGTAEHLLHLESYFQVTGLDASGAMLAVARQKMPDVNFHEMSMTDFSLGQTFNAITCLFSAIGYVENEDDLGKTIQQMARHLKPSGLIIVESALTPEQVQKPSIDRTDVNIGGVSVTRIASAVIESKVLNIKFEYELTSEKGEVQRFVEYHPIKLFQHEQYVHAFESAGLQVKYVESENAHLGYYLGTHMNHPGL